jgi:hypothetical protein
MALQAFVESLDAIPENLREHYRPEGAGFALDAPDLKPVAEFDHLRTAYEKRLAESVGKGNGLGREDLRAFASEIVDGLHKDTSPPQDNNNGGGTPDARLGSLEREIAQMRQDLEKKTQEATSAIQEANAVRLETQLTAAAVRAGVIPQAVDKVVSILAHEFELDDKHQAKTRIENAIGANLEPDAYLEKIRTSDSFSFFWPDSRSGGADRPGSRGSGGEPNPWAKGHWNLTAQGAMVQTDPDKAERMAKAAGSEIGATAPSS